MSRCSRIFSTRVHRGDPSGDTGWPRGKGLGELVYDEKGDGIRANEVKATRFSSFFFLSSRWIDLGSEFEEKRGLCIIG